MGVFPCPVNFSRSSLTREKSIFFSSINFILPRKIFLPSIFPCTPKPGKASKSESVSSLRPRFFTSETTAWAKGCSEFFSREPASTSKWSVSNTAPGDKSTSATSGLPLVRVPVLSNTIVSSFSACSKASPPLIRIPISAPFPVPTMIAVGVARPNAQGQAMIITEMNAIKAKRNGVVGKGPKESPKLHQNAKTKRARTITTGTKIAAILSASLCTGAFDPCACSTR